MIVADRVVQGARQILTMAPGHSAIASLEGVPDRDLLELGLVCDGAIAIQGGRVAWVGSEREMGDHVMRSPATTVLDAEGGIVLPGLVDPHTHLVFAGSRHEEFALRLRGASYLEILAAGGGILATVDQTRRASAQELAEMAMPRLRRLLASGVTTAEVKSGYGLDVATEIRLLDVVRALSTMQPVRLVPTLLAAHAVPNEYKTRREAYVRLLVEEMIPRVAERKLAEACDVYLDDGAFSLEEARAILEAARAAGLRRKLHAGQWKDLGGAELAAELGATSADHLEHVSKQGLDRMAEAGVVGVLLPGASLTLRQPTVDGRRIRDAGVEVALGTDCNPGTSYTENLPLIAALGVLSLGLGVEEAVFAVTRAASKALGRERTAGTIGRGAAADLVVLDVPDYRCLAYRFGTAHTRTVLRDGEVVWERRND